MEKYTANAEQTAWLTEKFGAVRKFSFTEDHETAWFANEVKISDGTSERYARGYGHERHNAVGDLFGFAAQIQTGEFFVQNGKRVDADPKLFNVNVVKFEAA